MREKLRGSRGETLVEVLASVLICSLSILLLFGAVMASGNLDLQAQEMDAEYYAALSAAEQQANPPQDPAGVSLTVTNDKTNVSTPDLLPGGTERLHFYGTEQERLLSYAIDKPESAPDPETGGGG